MLCWGDERRVVIAGQATTQPARAVLSDDDRGIEGGGES